MGRAVVHFEVIAKDARAMQEYYGALFGWEFEQHEPMHYGTVDRTQNLNADGIGIGGGVGAGPEGYPGHVTFYVEVPDVEQALAEAVRLGGTREMGPEDLGGGLTIGMFHDPEGRPIGLVGEMP